jgi:hypothetical protein
MRCAACVSPPEMAWRFGSRFTMAGGTATGRGGVFAGDGSGPASGAVLCCGSASGGGSPPGPGDDTRSRTSCWVMERAWGSLAGGSILLFRIASPVLARPASNVNVHVDADADADGHVDVYVYVCVGRPAPTAPDD